MVTKPALHDTLTDSVRLEASDLFEFIPWSDDEVCVNASLLYPDGEEVQVWVLERGGEYLVTDHGDAYRWLRTARCFHDLSERQLSLIEEVRRSLALDGEGVELIARIDSLEKLPFAILDVALAAVRVADISYTCGGAA